MFPATILDDCTDDNSGFATRDPSVLTELRQRYDLLRGDVTRTVTRTLPESRRQRLQVTEG